MAGDCCCPFSSEGAEGIPPGIAADSSSCGMYDIVGDVREAEREDCLALFGELGGEGLGRDVKTLGAERRSVEVEDLSWGLFAGLGDERKRVAHGGRST